jgi:hypothetical protein
VKPLHLNPKLSRDGGRILPSPEYICVFTDVHQTQLQLLETGRDIILLQVARFNTWRAADGGYEGLNYMPMFALILERINDLEAKYRSPNFILWLSWWNLCRAWRTFAVYGMIYVFFLQGDPEHMRP